MKIRHIVVLLVMITVAAFGAFAQKGDATAGKSLYTKKCATCHGADGEGKAAIAKMMKVELKHLGSKEVQAKSDEELRKISSEGVGKMAAVKGLSAADLNNLVAYMRSLAKK